ncbi:hypothetical protein, partial [Bacillus smithii]|uniref:hypothetical protein n=1 Tax=Bacillus smithii TaxID=1479 RepID=UPI0022E5B938
TYGGVRGRGLITPSYSILVDERHKRMKSDNVHFIQLLLAGQKSLCLKREGVVVQMRCCHFFIQ